MGKIITDNLAYVRTVQVRVHPSSTSPCSHHPHHVVCWLFQEMGTRDNAKNCDLSDILPEDIEARVKEAAEISMGTEISDNDIINIKQLCHQVNDPKTDPLF